MIEYDAPNPEANLQLLQVEDEVRAPPTAAIAEHHENLKCFHEGHAECEDGCNTGPNFLAAKGYIQSDPAADRTTFTALFVWAIANLAVRGVQFSWTLLDGTINAITDVETPGYSFENFRETVRHAIRLLRNEPALIAAVQLAPLLPGGGGQDAHDDIEPNESINSSGPPSLASLHPSDGASNNSPNPNVPPPNQTMDMKMFLEFLRESQSQLMQQFQQNNGNLLQQMQESNATNNETIFSRATRLTMDSTLHIANKFYGKLEDGKEVYFAFRRNFLDRADRLGWDEPTRCQQMFFCCAGRALNTMDSLRMNAHGAEKDTWTKHFTTKMLPMMDELFAHAGLTYGLNWRKASLQREKEFFQDYYTRARAERARFWQVHEKYCRLQILPPRDFLRPYVEPAKSDQILFDDTDNFRLQKIIDKLANVSTDQTTRLFIQTSSLFRSILANAIPQLKQQMYDDLRDVVWKQFLILDDWTHTCWLMADGIHNTKLREEAYKHRDKWYNKPELGTPEGSRIMTEYFFHLLKMADRLHDKPTYLNIGAAGAKDKKAKSGPPDDNDPNPGPANVQQINNKDGKKSNKRQNKGGKVGGVDGDPAPQDNNTNQPAQQATTDVQPPPARRRRMPVPPSGDPYKGDDGLIRTPGQTCTACGTYGHIEKDCGKKKKMAASGQGHMSSIIVTRPPSQVHFEDRGTYLSTNNADYTIPPHPATTH